MTPAVSTRLLELTRDLNNDIRIAAIYALGEGGNATLSAVNRLLELTHDSNNDIRIAATKALGRIFRIK